MLKTMDVVTMVSAYVLCGVVLVWSIAEYRTDLLTLAGVIYLIAENIKKNIEKEWKP